MNRIPYGYCGSNLWNSIVTGVILRWRLRLWTQVLVAAMLVSTAHAQSPKQLWVLQEPDEIVGYDVATFAARRTLKVPRRVVEHPEYLNINAKGQMVFLPPLGAQWGGGEMASAGDRAWFWDGRQAQEWKLQETESRSGAVKPTVVETARQWFLSAGGESLFRFENRFETVTDESGPERSVRSTARVWRTDLAGGRPETITTLPSSGWCGCATGVCSETCPEWSFWAPDGVGGDFFLVTRFTPGQLGATYHESLLYRRSGGTWQAKKLTQPVLMPLTASEKGETLVAAVPDGGCCGWENESSDQTLLLLRNGTVSVLYDEFDRYDNRNYDVSFYTADARLEDGNAMLAHTIVSTARAGSPIRLSSDGKENAEELARLRKAIAELPAVEVVQLGIQPRPAMAIRHAALVGWVNDREILVAQDGRLAVYDIRGGKRKETTIRVRSAADAFLR